MFQLQLLCALLIKDILPDVFKEYFIYNSDINAYETRNANKLYIPLYRNNFSRTQISYKGPVLWNSFAR